MKNFDWLRHSRIHVFWYYATWLTSRALHDNITARHKKRERLDFTSCFMMVVSYKRNIPQYTPYNKLDELFSTILSWKIHLIFLNHIIYIYVYPGDNDGDVWTGANDLRCSGNFMFKVNMVNNKNCDFNALPFGVG